LSVDFSKPEPCRNAGTVDELPILATIRKRNKTQTMQAINKVEQPLEDEVEKRGRNSSAGKANPDKLSYR
jgi:23S rRNA maturation mini-RNase III